MHIVEDEDLRRLALDELKREYGMDITRPGIHQAQLIYCLTKSYWGLTDPEPTTDHKALLFGIGFGLERVLLRPSEATPEPLELDGIVVSLDSIHQFNGPVDLKSTRMSHTGRKGEDGFQWPESWKHAFMAYRHVLNMTTCGCGHSKSAHWRDYTGHDLGRCHGADWGHQDYAILCHSQCKDFRLVPAYDFGCIVVHLIRPEMTAWRVTFTPEELEEHWAYLLTRRDQLDSMLAGSNPMPFVHNQEWECRDCEYLMRCQLKGSLDSLMLR